LFIECLSHQLPPLRRFEPIDDVGKNLDRSLIGLPQSAGKTAQEPSLDLCLLEVGR
jgi:hypothetical protein